MSSPSLLALTAPAAVPSAAIHRLSQTASYFSAEAQSSRSGGYAGLLARCGEMADKAVLLLPVLLAGSGAEGQTLSVLNIERFAKAAGNLFALLAPTLIRRRRADAMRWFGLCHDLYNDVHLTRVEYARGVTLGMSGMSTESLSVRILPGGEATVQALVEADVLLGFVGLSGNVSQDPDVLSADLERWVVVS